MKAKHNAFIWVGWTNLAHWKQRSQWLSAERILWRIWMEEWYFEMWSWKRKKKNKIEVVNFFFFKKLFCASTPAILFAFRTGGPFRLVVINASCFKNTLKYACVTTIWRDFDIIIWKHIYDSFENRVCAVLRKLS